MMHFRKRTLIADESQAKKYDRKMNKWRKGCPRCKWYRKVVKIQSRGIK